ncbi:GNAT family protein [Clostridium sp. ZS2]|uniref:GNAT family N-acetyltransferase n=1 Tax=Clostridium sp. ZS2 TaxID=2949988 RepID=UPI00207982AF|nr:GNAT family protein [Clostridium sp. ZS2]
MDINFRKIDKSNYNTCVSLKVGEHQNKGLGSKALEKFLDFFHDKFPSENLYTSAEIDNEVAIKLYEKYGFNKKNSFKYEVEGITYEEFRMLKKLSFGMKVLLIYMKA